MPALAAARGEVPPPPLLFFLLGALAGTLAESPPSFSCGATSSLQEFSFVSPAYPVSLDKSNLSCQLTIDHGCPEAGEQPICQVRLDFTEMLVQPPILGNCRYDKFYVSANGKYPLLCGENSGQHIYLDVAGRSSSDLTFSLAELNTHLYSCADRFALFKNESLGTSRPDAAADRLSHPVVTLGVASQLPQASFPTRRAWKVQVTQIPCGCSSITGAPDGCLQYYSGISGSVKSFNYDNLGCFPSDQMCNSHNLASCTMYAGYTGHLNNLDYTACFEEEYGFCGMEYFQAAEVGSFSLTNITDLNENFSDTAAPGSQYGDGCGADYILLSDGRCKNNPNLASTDRFCGSSFGAYGTRQTIVSKARPYMFRVVTDSDEVSSSVDYMNRGFHLNYLQTPCR